MTGTQNHEGIAGVLAAIEYLADLGRRFAPDAPIAARRWWRRSPRSRPTSGSCAGS